MAADWLKVRIDVIDDPAVVLIAHETGIDGHGVIGRLINIWGWANRHTTDGRVRGVTAGWVDDFLGTPGFAAAMAKAGWLHTTKTGLGFPNFSRHNSESAMARALTLQRVRRHREVKRKCNAASVTQALPEAETEAEKEKRQSIARTSSAHTRASVRMGGLGDDGACQKGASQQGARDACPSPAEAGPGSTRVLL